MIVPMEQYTAVSVLALINDENAIDLVRTKMLGDTLVVEVHCVKELWQETSP
jgi:hypothetical protein